VLIGYVNVIVEILQLREVLIYALGKLFLVAVKVEKEIEVANVMECLPLLKKFLAGNIYVNVIAETIQLFLQGILHLEQPSHAAVRGLEENVLYFSF